MNIWFADTVRKITDFSGLLNTSIMASWMVLAVIGLRFLLKKAPKWTHVALWGLVAVRLLLPFSIESEFSLIPSTQTVPQEILRYEGTQLTEPARIDVISNPVFSDDVSIELEQTVDYVQIQMMYMTFVWIAGAAVLVLYMMISCLCLYRKVNTAVCFRDNIFQSDYVSSPFVLGIIRPRIYLPFRMDAQNREYVIAHEQAHIRRHDHWWKPFGFLLLTVHWFNPVMWLAYILLCRDIEMACDERVVKEYSEVQRADYSEALLRCSVKRSMISACPLAFGEVSVKTRIRSVLNYRKPAFWIVGLAVIAYIAAAVCFLTDPVENRTILREIEMETVAMAMESAEACISEPPNLGNIPDPFREISEISAYHFHGTTKGEMVYTARNFANARYERSYISKLYNTHKSNNPSSDSLFVIPNSMLPLVPYIISIENEGSVRLRMVIYGSSDGKKLASHMVEAGKSITLKLESTHYWYMGLESVGFTNEPVYFRGSVQNPDSLTYNTSTARINTTLSSTEGQLIFDNTVVAGTIPEKICEYRYIPVSVSDTMRENLFEAYFGERADEVFCKDEQKDIWQLGETMSGDFYRYNTVSHVSGANVFTLSYRTPDLNPLDENRKDSGEPSGCTITAEEAVSLCDDLLASMTDLTQYKIDYIHHYGNNGQNPFYWICYKRILDGLTVNAYKDIYFFVDDNGVEDINGAFFDTEITQEYTDYLTAEEAVDALEQQLPSINWKEVGNSAVSRISLEYVTVRTSSGSITIVPIWRMELGNSEEERILNRNRILGIHAVTGELVQDWIGMGRY